MSRCMRELKDSETARSQEQMVAICLRLWRGEKHAELVDLLERAAKVVGQYGA